MAKQIKRAKLGDTKTVGRVRVTLCMLPGGELVWLSPALMVGRCN